MAENVNKVIYGEEVLIDLTQDTVTAEGLAKGLTAHDKSGKIITGENTFDADTSDASAIASEILKDKTAYVNGQKIEGTMPNRAGESGTITTKDQEYAIQNGYHDGSGKVKIDTTEQKKIIPGNIKSGVEILGVTGTYEGEGGKLQSKTAVPYVDKVQTILPDEGFDSLSQVTVDKIAYLETPNAQGGNTVTIGTMAPTE